MTVLVAGCTSEADTSTAGDVGTPSTVTPTETTKFPFSTEEAQSLAQEIIENIDSAYFNIFGYEGEELSEEQMLERLDETKKYVTTDFFNTHLADVVKLCMEEYCPYINLPQSPYFGLRQELTPISATHYQASTVFATMNPEDSNSYRQTVDFRYEDGAWKIDDFSNKDEDLNLHADEIEMFLKKQTMDPVNIEYVGTSMIDGKEEQLYQFQDSYSLYPFELIARSGHFYYIGEDIVYEDWETENTSGDMIGSDFDFYYSLLFDDHSVYKTDIDTSTKEAQQFLQRLEALEAQWQWAPPYYEEDRTSIQSLHEAYETLYQDAYHYYVNLLPTIDGINELEQHNRSFYYVRSQYFESIGVSLFSIYDESVSDIASDIEILRNQIYKIMLYSP